MEYEVLTAMKIQVVVLSRFVS